MKYRFLFSILFLLSSCSVPYKLRQVARPQVPLYIAMPLNEREALPLGPLLYDVFIQYFAQRGYTLVSDAVQGYVLKTTIERLDTKQHFISKDVVLLNKLVEISLVCGLYNFRNELIKEKKFIFYTIVPKALIPLQQDIYTHFYLRGMLEHNMRSIELFLKPYLQ